MVVVLRPCYNREALLGIPCAKAKQFTSKRDKSAIKPLATAGDRAACDAGRLSTQAQIEYQPTRQLVLLVPVRLPSSRLPSAASAVRSSAVSIAA